MGSHWLHWKAKSSLWALAVLDGGYIIRFTWWHTDISLYLPISWLFWMGSHWPHWKAKSSLWALAVSNGGRGIIGRGIISSLSALVFLNIFLLIDGFKWALIGDSEELTPMLWQFRMGGGGIIVCLSALVFLYIFLLVDHFECALIGNTGTVKSWLSALVFSNGGG